MKDENRRMKKRSNLIPTERGVPGPGANEANNFELAAESFLRYCQAENLAASTIKYYENGISQIRKLMEYAGVTRTDEITEDVIRQYIIYRIESGASASTINQYLRNWRPFGTYMVERGVYLINPFKVVENLRFEKKLVPTFTKEQIRDLFDAIDLTTFTGYRDYVIILLMLENGVRLKEALNVKLTDILWSEGMIKIYGKGRKERLVPFQEELEKHLRKYIHIRGQLDHDYVFISVHNLPLKNRSFQDNIRNYGRRARIRNVRVSPHTFRFTFVKYYIAGGGDAFSLQRILGHTTMNQVNHYANMFNTDVAKQHQKYSPLKGLLKRKKDDDKEKDRD